MFRPGRTLLSLALVVGGVWFSFNVRLGAMTLAQHLDAIGETTEARALVEGARGTVNPALDEAKQRLLGEHVEAPTRLVAPAPRVHAVGRRPSDARAARRPGQGG